MDCPDEGRDRWDCCPQDGDVGSCHCYQWRKGCTGARNGGGGGNCHRGCGGLAGIGKDAGLGLFHLQAISAPPDSGGGSPPDASKTHQAMMIGAGGFRQGFAASGCIGLSASGCQPTAEKVSISLKINTRFKMCHLGHLLGSRSSGNVESKTLISSVHCFHSVPLALVPVKSEINKACETSSFSCNARFQQNKQLLINH